MDKLVIASVIACFLSVAVNVALMVQTVRARRTVLDARTLVEDVSALHEQMDSVRRMVKRIVARDNMREYRERQSEEPAPKRKKNGAAPDWRDDPQAFIAHHEARLGLNRRSNSE